LLTFSVTIAAKISKFDQSYVKPKVGRFETEEERKRKEPPQYVTNHPGQSSLVPLAGREMSTGQSAVTLCGWGVKKGRHG